MILCRNLEAHQNYNSGSKVTAMLLNWCKDYFGLWQCRNCNMTAESSQIATRRPQTPDEAIGTLCAKFAKQEVFDGFVYRQSQSFIFMGKIEGS